jgi:lauroyl/myristoyl acyltransferase
MSRHDGVPLPLLYARDVARFAMLPAAALAPARLAYRIALLVADREYRSTSLPNATTEALSAVLGDSYTDAERRRLVLECIRLRKCDAMDRLRTVGVRQSLRSLISFRGRELLQQALSEGRGALVCTAHCGSFMAGVACLGVEGFPVTLIRRSMENFPEYAEVTAPGRWYQQLLLSRSFERFLQRTIITGEDQFAAGVQIARSLRANEVVVSFVDPPPPDDQRDKAVLVPFFGAHAPLMTGAITIAQRTRSPILLMLVHRAPDYRHSRLELLPITPEATPEATLARCIAKIEETIRARPAEWFYWPVTEDLRALGLLPETTPFVSPQESSASIQAPQ